MDIETAPKDGRRVLVFDPASRGGTVFIAHWLNWPMDRMREGWHTSGGKLSPTHWMPIPTPPPTIRNFRIVQPEPQK